MASRSRSGSSRTPRSTSGGRGASRARTGGITLAPQVGSPRTRLQPMLALVMALIVVLGGRLVWVQGFDIPARAEQAVQQRTAVRTVSAVRGDIEDRSGTVLARSVERYDLWVNQKQVGEYLKNSRSAPEKGVPAAAKQLAPLLGWSIEETEAKLTGDKGFVYLLKNVEPSVRNAAMKLGIDGIGADRVSDRTYPNGQVAGNVIGFVGADGTALAGTELAFDSALSGADGEISYERGAGGQIIPTGVSRTTPAVDGSDVVLTLDADLQWKAQQILAGIVDRFGASGASMVVLDPHTGEVLVLAETPTYDPNDPGATDEQYRGNQSLSNVFEPGSTGKLFTVATALEQGTITPATEFTVPYTQEFGGEMFKDSHPHDTMQYTTAGILKNSSNTGTLQIAETVTPAQRYDTLRAFGLGERTGVGLPGESAGILHPLEDWKGRLAYTTAFGQGYSVTPLQIVSAVSAFANDGVRMQPTLIAGTRDTNGIFTPSPVAEGVRATDPQTAATILELMDNDIDDVDGNAAVAGYAVGGKTGSAQNMGDGTYTASFIGAAPIDDPDLVIGVFVYGLTTYISGNTAAAPAFSEMMTYALQTQGIPPTGVAGRELENEW